MSKKYAEKKQFILRKNAENNSRYSLQKKAFCNKIKPADEAQITN
jgi:hypothetical protein